MRFLVAPGDSDATARKILELYRSRELTGAMGKAARERAEELDWIHVAEQTCRVYQAIECGGNVRGN